MLAGLHYRMGRPKEAQNAFEEALKILTISHGPSSPLVAKIDSSIYSLAKINK